MSSSREEILEQQSERFYALYERKARSFRTALIAVTGLLTIVFVLIFYPYVTFRGTRYVLEGDLERLAQEIAQTEAQAVESRQWLSDYRENSLQALDTIADVDLRTIENAAPEHRRRLETIRQALRDDPELEPWLSGETVDEELPAALRRRHPELSAAEDDPCLWRTGESWIRCTLNLQIGRAHGRASEPFEYARISHLRNDLFVPVHDALSKLRGAFGAYLSGEARSWEIDGREVDGSLRDQHSLFVGTYQDLLGEHERFIYEAVDEFETASSDLRKEREALDQELETVVARLKEMQSLQEIQTPFGQLPVGLNELVLLFPVLLAAGFTLCASLFSESLKLRGEYHRLSRGRDPTGVFFDEERIALLAPVWIDPLQPLRHRIYRSAVLALPVAVFVVALYLLVDDHLLFGPFMTESRLGLLIYVTLYVISALAMIEGGRRVWRALLAYQPEWHADLPEGE